MRSFALLAAAVVVPQAMAHYVFPALVVNGEETARYEYVRENKNSNSPVMDVTSDDMVCNVGGNDANVLAKTKTKAVNAGDSLGFTVESDISHPGPLAVYLSKAPSGVASYKGDGDWFKVYELTTSGINAAGLQWASSGFRSFNFTLPKEVPTGEYLLRVEHLALHGAGSKGGAQFFISCAQISVAGAASGTPGPTVKFPGAYTGDEPGLVINLYWPIPTSYTPAGPAVWPGTGAGAGAATPTKPGSSGNATPTRPGSGGNATATAPATPATSDEADDGCEAAAARRYARAMRRRSARAAF